MLKKSTVLLFIALLLIFTACIPQDNLKDPNDIIETGKGYLKTYCSPYGITEIPGTGFYPLGSTVEITAPIVDGYRFSYWYYNNKYAGTDRTLKAVIENSINIVIGVYQAGQEGIKITIKANDALEVKVDDEIKTTPFTLYSDKNATHTLEFPSPQYKNISAFVDGNDVLYKFEKWNDDIVDNPRTIVVTEEKEYIGIFKESYAVQAEVDINTPIFQTMYIPKGDSVTITAPDIDGYEFTNWEINGIKADTTKTIIKEVNEPLYCLAKYKKIIVTKNLTINTKPPNLPIYIDGIRYSSPKTVSVDISKEHTIGVEQDIYVDSLSIVSGDDTHFNFLLWEDGYETNERIISISDDSTYTAQYVTFYKIETESTNDITTIKGDGWYSKDTTVLFTAPDVDQYVFDHWEVNGETVSTDKTLSISVIRPLHIKAVYTSNAIIAAPTNLKLYGSDKTYFILTWKDNSNNEYGFELWRKIEDGEYKKYKTTGPNVYVMYDTYPVEGKIHYYKIRAYTKDYVYSAFSNEVTSEPEESDYVPKNPSPSNKATNVNPTVKLKWEVNTSDDLKFNVYIGTRTNNLQLRFGNLTNKEVWIVLKPNTTYYWKVEAKKSTISYSSEIWEFTTGNETKQGAVKIANSWGIGNWENVPDGFFWITYEALKENHMGIYVIPPAQFYKPRLYAVFEIEHPLRLDAPAIIGKGDPATSTKVKSIFDFYLNAGMKPYPKNKIVLDITEFLPLNNDTIFLKVAEGNETATGTISYFALEVYDDAFSKTPIQIYEAEGLPIKTKNGETVYVRIDNLNITKSSVLVKKNEKFDFKNITNTKLFYDSFGIFEPNKNYNVIINGHGTGYIPPSKEMWEELKPHLYQIEPTVKEALPSAVDHSKEPWFPPIGNQGYEGSCSSWAVAYYTSTYYQAKLRGWDLTDAEFEKFNVDTKHAKFVMSPEFIYPLVNGGIDGGSYVHDNISCIKNIGVASFATTPYDPYDHTSLAPEAGWREAPLYRNLDATYYMIRINSDDDINTIKTFLNNGYLLVITMQASLFPSLKENDVFDVDNYKQTRITHAVTIVGYDDSVK